MPLLFVGALVYALLGGLALVPKPWYVIVAVAVIGSGSLGMMGAP